MSTPEEIHAAMAEGYAKQRIPQAVHDERRRVNHFQVRLPQELADKLRHYMDSRDLNANQALNTIVSKFFH
jgi:hypothetical protein